MALARTGFVRADIGSLVAHIGNGPGAVRQAFSVSPRGTVVDLGVVSRLSSAPSMEANGMKPGL